MRARRLSLSAWLAVAYVTAIPAFGLVYLSNSSQFYSTTARYEPDHAQKAMELPGQMVYDIKAQYERVNGSSRFESPEYSFDIDRSLVILDLTGSPSGITFSVVENLFYRDQPLASAGVTSAVVATFDASVPGEARDYSHTGWSTRDLTITNHRGAAFDDSQLFPFQYCGYKDCAPELVLSKSTSDALFNWWRTELGFPYGSDASFARMLYLSATTITTLGPGDVVPVTDDARMVVTIEAIYGVVVAGAFLSSIFLPATNELRKRDHVRHEKHPSRRVVIGPTADPEQEQAALGGAGK